jgi:hypothetical protein
MPQPAPIAKPDDHHRTKTNDFLLFFWCVTRIVRRMKQDFTMAKAGASRPLTLHGLLLLSLL